MTFHGAFIFRKQDYGILSSTYFNNKDFKPYPETAKLKASDKDDPADLFAGKYETIWLEKTSNHICDLEIKKHVQGVYSLVWTNSKGVKEFDGYGMLENGNLVGFYY